MPRFLDLSASGFRHGVLVGGLVLCGLALLLVLFAVLAHRRQTRVDVDRPGLWAVVGGMGAGKTYLLSWVGCRAIRRGRPVFANYHLRGASFLSSWSEVVSVPDGAVVLLAEVQLWWPSHVRRGLPEVEGWVSQLRHHGITCLWDAQHVSFVSSRFRKLTFGVWEGRRLGFGHEYTLYTGRGFGGQRKPFRLGAMRVRRDRAVERAYDTLEDVRPNLDWAELRGVQQDGRTAQPLASGSEPGSPAPSVLPASLRLYQ